MKKIYTLILLFTITLFYSIQTQAFDIPLNYGVSDNDQSFVQTKNLFDESVSIWIPNQFYTVTGSIQLGGSDSRLDNYVSVLQNTQYTISTKTLVNVQRIIYYNSSFTFISSFTPVSPTATFTTPANTEYIRFHVLSLDAANDTNIQLELGSTSTSYSPYGFLSLNDIFVDGQLLINPFFTDGSTGYIDTVNATFIDDTVIYPTNVGAAIRQVITTSINDKFYYTSLAKIDNTTGGQAILFLNSAYNITGSNIGTSNLIKDIYSRNSFILTIITSTATRIQIGRNTGNSNVTLDENFLYNLNTLGIDHLTKNTLDALFNDWQTNNIYDQGFDDGYIDGFDDGYDDGFDVGYDEGFDDGVASDTSYAVGYALGLSEGEDMETGSSLLILIVALIGFVMMIFGFTTKRGIFNLLSVGAFIVLGTLLVQFVGFVIIAIGLVLINIYYAFFGDL